MNDALVSAIRDRIRNGISVSEIRREVLSSGHSEEAFAAAYTAAAEQEEGRATDSNRTRTWALIKHGFDFAQNRLELIGQIIAVSLIGLLPFVLITFAVDDVAEWKGVALGISMFVFTLVQYVNTAALLYIAAGDDQSRSYQAGVSWAFSNFFPILWLSILTAAVIIPGLLLLVIPGLIIAIYIGLSSVALVREQLGGLSALSRSVTLIRGNVWRYVKLILASVLIGMLLGLAIGVVQGVISVIVTMSDTVEEIIALVVQVFSQTVVTAITVAALGRLYTDIQAEKAAELKTAPAVYPWVRNVAIAGGVIFGLLMLGIISAILEAQ